jgi:hypothetical protein
MWQRIIHGYRRILSSTTLPHILKNQAPLKVHAFDLHFGRMGALLFSIIKKVM